MLRLALIPLMLASPGFASQDPCFSRNWAEVTHSHRDLGEGRVSWVWSWNAEGVADDVHLADCTQGTALIARVRAERMQNPIPFDRRARAQKTIDLALSAPAFFRLDILSEALNDIRVPTRLAALEDEPCACATFYPDAFDSRANTMRDQ